MLYFSLPPCRLWICASQGLLCSPACYCETQPTSHFCSCIDISVNIFTYIYVYFHPKHLSCSSCLHVTHPLIQVYPSKITDIFLIPRTSSQVNSPSVPPEGLQLQMSDTRACEQGLSPFLQLSFALRPFFSPALPSLTRFHQLSSSGMAAAYCQSALFFQPLSPLISSPLSSQHARFFRLGGDFFPGLSHVVSGVAALLSVYNEDGKEECILVGGRTFSHSPTAAIPPLASPSTLPLHVFR